MFTSPRCPGSVSPRKPRRPRDVLAFALLGLLALAGCRGEGASQGDHDHDEEHAGHVIPLHKPKDFPEAVRRLRTLNERIGLAIAKGKVALIAADGTLPVSLDIAEWLPEIAADSDMSEDAWDQVGAQSSAIVASYRIILGGAAGVDNRRDARAAVKDADRAISNLEGILARADPRWFAGGETALRPD